MVVYQLDQNPVLWFGWVNIMPRLIPTWTLALDTIGTIITLKMENLLAGRKRNACWHIFFDVTPSNAINFLMHTDNRAR